MCEHRFHYEGSGWVDHKKGEEAESSFVCENCGVRKWVLIKDERLKKGE